MSERVMLFGRVRQGNLGTGGLCPDRRWEGGFQDVGLNIVYLPSSLIPKGEQEAIGHPFLLEYDGHKKES